MGKNCSSSFCRQISSLKKVFSTFKLPLAPCACYLFTM
jgi:hypothetical protein